MAGGALPCRHELARILVPELIETEGALCRDRHRFLQELARVQAPEALRLAQVALAVRIQAGTGLRKRHFEADRGEGVLQAPACAHVHVHIARSEERHAVACAELLQPREPECIRALAQQFHCHPQVLREARGEPLELLLERGAARHPQHPAVLGRQLLEVRAPQGVAALLARAAAAGDEAAQARVAVAVDGEGRELQPAAQAKL